MSTEMSLNEYAHLYATLHCSLCISNNTNLLRTELVTTVITKYHVKKGIEIFIKDGVGTVLAELKQLHDRMVIDPGDSTK